MDSRETPPCDSAEKTLKEAQEKNAKELQGSCAHQRVVYRLVDCNAIGWSHRWVCEHCGYEFHPAHILEMHNQKAHEVNTLVGYLLDISDRFEDAQEALNHYWSELESALHPDILQQLKDAAQALNFIGRIVTQAVGGADQLVRLQSERSKKEEK